MLNFHKYSICNIVELVHIATKKLNIWLVELRYLSLFAFVSWVCHDTNIHIVVELHPRSFFIRFKTSQKRDDCPLTSNCQCHCHGHLMKQKREKKRKRKEKEKHAMRKTIKNGDSSVPPPHRMLLEEVSL